MMVRVCVMIRVLFQVVYLRHAAPSTVKLRKDDVSTGLMYHDKMIMHHDEMINVL